MNIYSIYKAVNKINGKCYVGFDSSWPKRKNRHLGDSYNKKSKSYNDAFHKAIRKYGKDNFEWILLYQSKDSLHCKNVMENYFIIDNNSFINSKNSNGYNMTLGGDGMIGFKHQEKSKKKNSISCGKKFRVWKNDGTLIESKHIKNFCLENDLCYDSFKSLLSGKLLSYKNYLNYNNEKTFDEAKNNYDKKIENSLNIMGEKHSKEYQLVSPTGEIIKFKNLAKFARENNLNPQCLKQVAMGKLKVNKGWRLP